MTFSKILFIIIVVVILLLVCFAIYNKPKLENSIALVISIIAMLISVADVFRDTFFPFKLNVVAGDAIFINPTANSTDSPPIILPISFVNLGYGSGMVQMITIKITNENDESQIYTPIAEIDFEKLIQDKHILHGENIKGPFGAFVINERESLKKYFLFSFDPNIKNNKNGMKPGKFIFEMNVRTDTDQLKNIKKFDFTISPEIFLKISGKEKTGVVLTNYNLD